MNAVGAILTANLPQPPLISEQLFNNTWTISSRSNISHKSGSGPRIRIVPLIPIDKALPSRYPRNSGPAASKNDVVLSIEEVGCIARVQIHGLESKMWREDCRCPLPQAAHIGLTVKLIVARHESGMPVGKANICATQVDEQVVRIRICVLGLCMYFWSCFCCCFGRAGDESITALWWSLFHTVVDEVTEIHVSSLLSLVENNKLTRLQQISTNC